MTAAPVFTSQLGEIMARITDALTAAGLRVAVDLAALNPPCALLDLPELTFRVGGNTSVQVGYRLVLIASNTRTDIAIDQLGDMLAAAQTVLGGRVQTAVPISLDSRDNTTTLPAMELRWTEHLNRRTTP